MISNPSNSVEDFLNLLTKASSYVDHNALKAQVVTLFSSNPEEFSGQIFNLLSSYYIEKRQEGMFLLN